MKYASVTVLALALIPSSIVVACASGNDDQLFDGGIGGGGGAGAGTGKASTAESSSSSSGGMCVSQCTTDADCQNSCPPAGANSNCCDTATGICFVSNTSTCPAPGPDGGDSGMPPY